MISRRTVMRAAAWAVALLSLAPVSVLVAKHLGDRFRVSLVSGSWLALARHAVHGLLYPEVFDGHVYGGTRFMPLPILLQSTAARISGEYLTSGKVVAAALAAMIVALSVKALRMRSAPWPYALMFASAFLLTEPGVEAAANFRGDGLPVVLQLAAVVVVMRGWIVPAALLCALSALSKLTGIWAPAAIACWLVLDGRRRDAGVFVAVCAVATLAGLGAFELLTDGRMMRNLRLAGSAIHSAKAFLRTPGKLLYILQHQIELAWALFPLVVVGLVEALRERRPTLFELCWAASFGLLLVVFADPGVSANHLLDLVVLSCLCVWDRWGKEIASASAPGLLALAVTCWAALAAFDGNVADALRDRTPYPAHPLEPYVERGERLLSEDPTLPVLMDETPLVTDGWILLRIAERDPALVAPLIGQLERHEIEKVILLRPVEDEAWYSEQMFGPAIRRAIADRYRPWKEAAGYHVYVPR